MIPLWQRGRLPAAHILHSDEDFSERTYLWSFHSFSDIHKFFLQRKWKPDQWYHGFFVPIPLECVLQSALHFGARTFPRQWRLKATIKLVTQTDEWKRTVIGLPNPAITMLSNSKMAVCDKISLSLDAKLMIKPPKVSESRQEIL